MKYVGSATKEKPQGRGVQSLKGVFWHSDKKLERRLQGHYTQYNTNPTS